MKKIYSLNLMAWVLYRTGIKPQILQDEEKYWVYYSVFPECEEISQAISEFKSRDLTCNLHTYLNTFSEIKRLIADFKDKQ